MAFENFLITEIFHSLQGETSLTGVPFAFVRLTGCNLRCTYCDSAYSFKGGRTFTEDQILETIRSYGVKHVLLTGGEPLLQRNTPRLVQRLKREGYLVSIETHGEVSIEHVARDARIVMDIKTPSSEMSRGGYKANLKFLKKSDEIKFVIGSKDDYEWAKNIVKKENLPTDEILFSPMVPALGAPGEKRGKPEGIDPTWLAEKILEDKLQVRLQLQLHKLLWGKDRKGV